jgi:hypothetical protein
MAIDVRNICWGDCFALSIGLLSSTKFNTVSRPEKSLHLLINNPVTSLHIFLNPEYRLHLFYRMKRKRALLRSNSPGIIQSDEHINPLLGLHLIMDLLFICTSAKPNKTYAIATSSFFCLLI